MYLKVTFKCTFFLKFYNIDLNLLFLIKHPQEELKESILKNNNNKKLIFTDKLPLLKRKLKISLTRVFSCCFEPLIPIRRSQKTTINFATFDMGVYPTCLLRPWSREMHYGHTRQTFFFLPLIWLPPGSGFSYNEGPNSHKIAQSSPPDWSILLHCNQISLIIPRPSLT